MHLILRKIFVRLYSSMAPGPDGFTTLFFQKYWDLVGHDVTIAALRILILKGDPSGWNNTIITLIPKVKNPLSPKDFRPISLCNICYKIVSKAITNRLKPIMQSLVNLNQSAFVPGRLITDSVIIGFECMHWIRCNTKNRSGFGALKTRYE